MRKLLTKIIQLLDGTPAVYGQRQSGQSVVELALITPILIVLLAGLVEIGWFANNYLNLLDVTRAGARRGAVLQDQRSPLFWENKYTYVPTSLLTGLFTDKLSGTDYSETILQMPQNAVNGTDSERFFYRWYPDRVPTGSWGDSCLDYDELTGTQFDRKFYNEVACTMITTMDPLSLNPENGVDDIIVSAFALQLIDATSDPSWLAASYDTTVPQMVVVGRYPTNANECNYQLDGAGGAALIGDAREGRDPFDFDLVAGQTSTPTDDFNELDGFDNGVTSPEKQVGFSMFGNHKIPGYACVGSEWTMGQIEDLMNLSTSFDLTTNINAQRLALPSQGVVIAEIYWEHEMLLKLPLLSPVFTAVGDPDGKMIINIWAAFPLSSIEPHIIFP